MTGETTTPEYHLDSIKHVPVSIWSGELDVTCSNWQARITKETIGERATHLRTIRGQSHGYWAHLDIPDDLFKEFTAQLIDPEHRSDSELLFVTS